jgi:phosphoribosylanthranilate isomerase
MSCLVKICGITNPEDAAMVSEAGADYLGILVNIHHSPRSVTPEKARTVCAASTIPVIVLTFDHSLDQVLSIIDFLSPAGIQLAGNETVAYVKQLRNAATCEIWKSLHVPVGDPQKTTALPVVKSIHNYSRSGVDKIVLDSVAIKKNKILKGGTGQTFDWEGVKKIKKYPHPFLFLAGGINPRNVTDALVQVAPDGIDLSSGVEESAGKKDPKLVAELMKNISKNEVTI